MDTPIRIILIDDDEDDYILTRDWVREFQGSQCVLEWISDYHAGMDALTQCHSDVYLIDYRLGEVTGLELLRTAIANGCDAPMILLTGQGDREIDIEAMKAGAVDYLEKSQLNSAILERAIRYAIERKKAEQKIRAQAALLNVATDAMFVCSLEGKILFWNPQAEKLYGVDAAKAIGQTTSQLWQERNPDILKVAHDTLMETGVWQGELEQITRHQHKIIVESRWTLVDEFEQTSPSILIVNTDITQKKLLESQILRTQRLESIGTLASGIAHDLNNVLAPILMTAQLLQSQLNDERSQRLLPIIINNAKRGANLVKQVLSFTRGIEGDRTVLQLKHVVQEIEQVIKETFPKSIELKIEVPPDLWVINGNATQLHQVIMNLCVNARDAMVNGGELRISLENCYLDANYTQMHLNASVGNYVCLTVSDTGSGIPPEFIDRIFEPFFTTKEIGKGTGLGLSTVQGIVQSHNGFIDVTSEIGQGSQFRVYFPADIHAEIKTETEPETYTGAGELILIVDDEEAIRDVTKTSLETHNYRAITARDGIQAIELYAQHRDEIAIVLTDMIMPQMDGLTTIRTLKKINPQVKIIAVSGLVPHQKSTNTQEIGVQAFLSKPYTAKQLLQTIDSLIRNQNQEYKIQNAP